MRPGRLAVLALVAATSACAGAKVDEGTDAPAPPDAERRPDAMPQPVTLTQVSDSASITPGTSIGCINNATLVTRENSWYRAFTLTDHGVTGGFAVTGVTFAVEQAQAAAGATQTATIRIHRYDGLVGATLELGAMTELASVPVQITNTQVPALRTVPIAGTIAAGDDLVVEVAVVDSDPDNDGSGDIFFPGSNSAGQSKPAYLRAPTTGCDLAAPTQLTLVGAGFPDMHLVLTVTGLPQ